MCMREQNPNPITIGFNSLNKINRTANKKPAIPDQLFCNLALFEFFSHIYAPGSFISKNGPLARRRHHWRRACVCRRQYY
jgi:hypothetical protein